VYGKLADVIGRKWCLMVAIGIFLFGSAMYVSISLAFIMARVLNMQFLYSGAALLKV
jgi:MFS family permease